MRVALVSCGLAKKPAASPAAEMYTSSLFRLSMRYAQITCDRTFILSAKHELLAPDQVIAPYNVSLAKMSAFERTRWADRVIGELYAQVTEPFDLLLLAGELYARPIRDFISITDEPLRGMPLFKRLAWLKQNVGTSRKAAA